jgi:hypothetical protein
MHARIDLSQTRAELRAAKRAVDAMTIATSLEELREAWQNFLTRIEKVWTKAERECQPVRQTFEPWQGKYKRVRRKDPLLAYLHHARNADHHTIQPVASIAKDVRVKVPPGGTATIEVNPTTRRVLVEGDVIEHTVGPARYALLAVEDSGVRYDPPTTHSGIAPVAIDPLGVARCGLEFYTKFVEEIEKKFGQDL